MVLEVSYEVDFMFVVEVEIEIIIVVLVKWEEFVFKGLVVFIVVFVVVFKEVLLKFVDVFFLFFCIGKWLSDFFGSEESKEKEIKE